MRLPSLKAGTQFIQPLRRVGFPAQSLSNGSLLHENNKWQNISQV